METSQETKKIRHDWYQTESHVFVNILCRNVIETNFNVKFNSDAISLSFIADNVQHNTSFKLLHEINPSESSYKILPSKIEVKLKKKEGLRWAMLENDGSVDKTLKQGMSKTLDYPTSSVKQKDWDKVVVEIMKSDDYKLEGEAALQALFQKIYSEGNDEVKKAMNKSFIESAGTVLSTNWGEVKKEKVNIKPPDNMEWKKWD